MEDYPFLLDLSLTRDDNYIFDVADMSLSCNKCFKVFFFIKKEIIHLSVQHGRGSRNFDLKGEESNSLLTIIIEKIRSYTIRSYKRFNLTGRKICVKFKKLSSTENNIQTWFENCMKELHYFVLKDSILNDYIGFEIRSRFNLRI